MTKAELLQEYARILEMCDNNEDLALQCIKYMGKVLEYAPAFLGRPNYYEFAVMVYKGKPLFEDDVRYTMQQHEILKKKIGLLEEGIDSQKNYDALQGTINDQECRIATTAQLKQLEVSNSLLLDKLQEAAKYCSALSKLSINHFGVLESCPKSCTLFTESYRVTGTESFKM